MSRSGELMPIIRQIYRYGVGVMKRSIEPIPIIRQIYRYVAFHRFRTNGYGRFWGVYETFEEAILAAPKTKKIGYDNPELALEYQQMLVRDNWENSGRTVADHDRPLIFRLNSIFERGEGNTIFDFGGNVGIHFYSYSKYLNYPPDLKWTICEVPEIAKIGKQIAEQRGISNLDFTSEFKDVENKNVLIGSGSIQYVDNLSKIVPVNGKPVHLLINRLPLYDGDRFVTLQNGGSVFYPQYIFNKAEFINGLENIGYELIDIWEDRHDSCIIPFYPDRSIDNYYGLYFQLKR
jgi:putative methyltransferase (TIGR04325 family)